MLGRATFRFTRPRSGWILAAALVAMSSSALAQPAPRTPAVVSSAPRGGLQVRGEGGRAATLTLTDIAGLPRETVKAMAGHGGASRTYEGARLIDVLRTVGAPLGARLHGPPATDLVVFSGMDGYRSVMALMDADPDSHASAKIIVADKVDGQLLDIKEGPLRLVIEGDLRSTRSVHGLAKVEIKRLP